MGFRQAARGSPSLHQWARCKYTDGTGRTCSLSLDLDTHTTQRTVRTTEAEEVLGDKPGGQRGWWAKHLLAGGLPSWGK